MFEPFQKFVWRAAGRYGVSAEVQAAEVCSCFRGLLGEWFDLGVEAEGDLPRQPQSSLVTVSGHTPPAVASSFLVSHPTASTPTEAIMGFIDAKAFNSGVLVVKVANGAFAQEVMVRKEKMMKDVNEKLGREVVKNIRTELGN